MPISFVMNQKPWVSALQISQADYELWQLSIGPEQSITSWAIQNRHISADAYFQWAKNYYGLPQVLSPYFNEAPSRELWNKIRSVTNWNQDILPLEEWDGVIFIGCVEPLDVQWSFPVCYVLTHPQNLKNLFEQYQTLEMSFTQIPPVPEEDGPIGLNLKLAPPPPPILPQEPQGLDGPEGLPNNHDVFFQDDIPTGVYNMPSENSDKVLNPQHAVAQIEEARTQDQMLNWFCKHALQHYSSVIILHYEGNLLKPFRITADLKPTSEQAFESIDPNKPSVFRIVRRTNIPYHGPVVDTEINKAFFSNFGFEGYPAVVTCLPLLTGTDTRGQILALGDDKCAPQEILQNLERLTQKLFPAILKAA